MCATKKTINQMPHPNRKKKKRRASSTPKRFWIGVSILVALIILILYFELLIEKKRPIWPEGHTVYGVDVSHYQKKIDWITVRENEIAFAFIKATEGKTLKDRKFEENWVGAGKANIIRGAYHFYLPYLSPDDQASNFISNVKLERGDLPPVLDIEKRGKKPIEQFRKDIKQWLDRVEEAYGTKPIIYTGYKFYVDYLDGHFDDYHLWIAHYKVSKLKLEKNHKTKLSFWQHTDDGIVKGVNGLVDCNVFYGSMRELRDICIKGE
jgi:lysozyme